MEIESPSTNSITEIMVLSNLAPSKKEAKRLIEQGGVLVEGEKVTDLAANLDITDYKLFKVGKRKFLRVKAK